MSSESTPSEVYHAEVRSFLHRQMSDTQTAAESDLEYPRSGCDEQDNDAADVTSVKAQEEDGLHLDAEEGTGRQGPAKWTFFSGNDDEHRYRRLRCGMLLAAFNSQPLSASMQDRTEAWNE